MAIRKFQDVSLNKYYFDTDRDVVMSLQSGEPRPLKWSRAHYGSPRRVAMVTHNGHKVSYRYDQIQRMLAPAEIEVSAKPAAAQCVTNTLSLLKPEFDYVLYSVQNRCSQYFFAGTTVQDALDRLARRGEVVKPADIRILNTVTGQVSRVAVQTVQTYSLV